jgi:hypothetical protein
MVSRILNALYHLRLIRLPGVGQFFDALIGRVRNLRESLRVARLPAAVWSDLTRVTPELIQLRVVIPTAHHECLLYYVSRRALAVPTICSAVKLNSRITMGPGALDAPNR